MNKTQLLKKITRKITCCKLCKRGTTGRPVPGEGNPDADVVFIGEAPGKEEAKIGRPFIGRSGKLLRDLIRDAGLQEKKVYITSPVKYLPKTGTPNRIQIKHGRKHLLEQLAIINPKFIVLLGRVACEAILEKFVPVLKNHGTVIKNREKKYFITLHPAAAIRFVKYKKILQKDFGLLKEIIES